MIFRYTIINNFLLSSQNPLLLPTAILNKNPPLAQRRPNVGKMYRHITRVGVGRQPSAQRRPNVGKICRPCDQQPTSVRRRHAIWDISFENKVILFYFTVFINVNLAARNIRGKLCYILYILPMSTFFINSLF